MKFKNKSENSLKYIILCSCYIISVYAATPFTVGEGSTKIGSRGNASQASKTNFPQSRSNSLPNYPITNKISQTPSQYDQNNEQIAYNKRRSLDKRSYSPTPYETRGENIKHNTDPSSSINKSNRKGSTPTYPRKRNDSSFKSIPENRPSSPPTYDTRGNNKTQSKKARPFTSPPSENSKINKKRESTTTFSQNGNERRRSSSKSKNSTLTTPTSRQNVRPNQQNSTKLPPQLKSMNRSNSDKLNNATFIAHNSRNSSILNNSPKFAKSGKGDVIPVVLKQSALNGTNKSKSNVTVSSPNIGRNTTNFNNATEWINSGEANFLPVVRKQPILNAKNNNTKLNTTVFSHNIGRNTSVIKNATNATFFAHNSRNSSILNNSPQSALNGTNKSKSKFSQPGESNVVPVVLNQPLLNANNRSKINTTVSSHNIRRNKSAINNATKLSQPGKVNNIMPVVLKQPLLNSNNRSKINTTVFSHYIGSNTSALNNATKFSQSGKVNFVPVVLKQPLLNANNRSKITETQPPQKLNNQTPSENSFFNRIAKAIPFLTSSNNSSSVKGFNPSSTDKNPSSILKNIIKALKKSNSDSYKIDYGTPMTNKGSELKLFGRKLTNSITGYLMAILIISAVTHRGSI